MEQTAKRIEALAGVRGTAPDVSNRFLQESEAIRWAHDEMLSAHYHHVLCVIGNLETVREVADAYVVGVDKSTDTAWAVIIDPDKVLAAQIEQILVEKEWPGNRPSDEKNTPWLTCDRYYACGDDSDTAKKAVLAKCFVNRVWLSTTDHSQARIMIGAWLENLYRSMCWEMPSK